MKRHYENSKSRFHPGSCPTKKANGNQEKGPDSLKKKRIPYILKK